MVALLVGLAQHPLLSASAQGSNGNVTVIKGYKHDPSPPVRGMHPRPWPPRAQKEKTAPGQVGKHQAQTDTVVQSSLAAAAMPAALLNFNGIPFPGVACNCA